ncbi:MAG: response regulator [Candidatus Thiodiazotropha sp. LLP2]
MKKNLILLVEDNPDDELLALTALKKNKIKHKVHVARDGKEAVEYLLGNSDDAPLPKVILLDLQLPKLSGLDVLKIIRESPRTQLLPVVVLTSSDEEKDLLESYRLGANSYIRKPVDFTQFVEAVQKLVTYWMAMNMTPRTAK